MILCEDMYSSLSGDLFTTFLALPPRAIHWSHGFPQVAILQSEKRDYGDGFNGYVDGLLTEAQSIVTEVQPDVIHAQHLGFGLSLAFSRLKGDIPLVTFGHGTDVIEAALNAEARKALNEIAAASYRIILPTQSMRREVDRLTDYAVSDRLRVIPWGIPLDQVVAKPRKRRTDFLHLVHAGRLDENKSTITAIESLLFTRHAHRLTVIGSGPMLPKLMESTKRWGLAERVVFEPFMRRDELWARMSEFDAFVFTTRKFEAFGLVAVEAQAHGLPVLHSRVAGVHDALGDSGIPYTPGDAFELAARIDELCSSYSLFDDRRRRSLYNASRYSLNDAMSSIMKITREAVEGDTDAQV